MGGLLGREKSGPGRPGRWRRLGVVQLPTTNVTSVAFGGPNLDDLHITTARQGLSDAQLAAEPHAGDLFVTRPGVSGHPRPVRHGVKAGPGQPGCGSVSSSAHGQDVGLPRIQ